jgi:peptide/nickel transport system substrate-binding protein
VSKIKSQLRRVRWLAPTAAAVAIAGLVAGVPVASHAAGRPSAASVKGAVATLPNIVGTGANCIFPMEPAQCYSTSNYEGFQYLMVRPLYIFGGNSDSVQPNYPLSPADAPIYANGGKTVVINFKGWRWSDGLKVDANDLIFFLNMLEAEKANYAAYTPGLLPDNIASYSATGPEQVTLHLRHAYSTIWYTYNQLAVLYPFPQAWDVTKAGATPGSGGCAADSAADHWARCKAVWNFLNSQNRNTSSYATNPLWRVVDGPFRLTAYNIDGNYTFEPNRKYSGSPKPSISKLRFVEYTSSTAIYTGLKTGALSEGQVPTDDLTPARKNFLPHVNPLAKTPGGGYYLQAALPFMIDYAYINYNDPTYGAVLKQLYFRQALALLDNQVGMNEAVGRGYSFSTVAGVPSQPPSIWKSHLMKENGGQGAYPYNVPKAEALLKAHGWKKVRGVLTCERAGTGPADCGAHIKKGRHASFSILYTNGIYTQEDQADILKSGFGEAGIQLTPKGESFDVLLGKTVPCTPNEKRCRWTFLYIGGWQFNGPGFEPSGEPLFQTGVVNNAGSYSSPVMDRLIAATHTSNSLTTFYQYADYTATQEPDLWLPSATAVEAVSKHMHGVSQSPLGMFVPEYWRCSSRSC